MKALTLSHPSLTREILLSKADEMPGAWIGIRIAALLLILSGWKSTQVAELFGLTRWAVVKWIRKANSSGIEAVIDRARSGHPPRLDEKERPSIFGWTMRDGIKVQEWRRLLLNILSYPLFATLSS